MPIIGLPIDELTTSEGVIAPEVTKVEGIESPSRLKAVIISQNQQSVIRWIFRNRKGDPIDLINYAIPDSTQSSSSSSGSLTSETSNEISDNGQLKVRAREILTSSEAVQVTAHAPDPGKGVIEFQLPSVVTGTYGIYWLEIGAFDPDDTLLNTDNGYLVVERGMWGDKIVADGLPSFKEIRLRMRDSGPEDNFLLTTVEFDDAEIADAIVRVVRYWNESQPQVPPRYTTSTFPFELYAYQGVFAQLYHTAAAHYRREHINYSAAGVTFDDKNKAQEYEMIGLRMWAEYARFVKMKKMQKNVMSAFGGVGSSYGALGY